MAAKGIAHEVTAPLANTGGTPQVVGSLDATGLRFGVVASRYNEVLTRDLVADCLRVLISNGAEPAAQQVVWVPGAYEIPSVVEQLAAGGGFDALIALGAVVEGETPHAELITTTVTAVLADIARQHGRPVIDTVVAARTYEQAEVRCRSAADSRGSYAARAAIEMVHVFRALPSLRGLA
jgi:6,7-dimethyl-8-ribityllumazine synthase